MTKISYFGDQNRLFWYAHPTCLYFNSLGTPFLFAVIAISLSRHSHSSLVLLPFLLGVTAISLCRYCHSSLLLLSFLFAVTAIYIYWKCGMAYTEWLIRRKRGVGDSAQRVDVEQEKKNNSAACKKKWKRFCLYRNYSLILQRISTNRD